MKMNLLVAMLIISLNQLTAQTPVLSSLPSAAPTIFLDFDGHLVEGSSWNYDGPINCSASGLTPTQINEVFNRVAEDYRPFVVNITTDSTKYTTAPVNKRMRVVITPTYEWYGSAGGVAFIGSFTWGDDSPCFVFSSLLNNNIKLVSEAISHEAGHTLGLYHQAVYNNSCVKTSDYNYGTGSGETGWAPIMGIGYYQNLTTWHNGPTPYGCANIQNDRDIIASANNGITVKADDNDNTSTNAPSLITSNNQFSASGNFEQINDEDLYKLQVITPARVIFSAKPANVGNMNAGANSDILVGLYNQSLLQIKTSNPSDSLQASIDTLLNTGTYYIRLKPVANTYASTYGMSGIYIINGMITPSTTLPLRKLELTGKADGVRHRLHWMIDADEQITGAALEYSLNGSSFTVLSGFSAASGFYSYSAPINQVIKYRCKVTFDNGQTHYSKTIRLQSGEMAGEPMILSNPVTNSSITVSNGKKQKYWLLDMQGRNLQTGYLNEGITTIPFQPDGSGIYLIKFSAADGSTCTKKIFVQ